MLRNVAVTVFILGLCVCGGSCQSGAAATDSFGTVRLEYTAVLTGDEARPCRIVVYLPENDTSQDPRPESIVIYDSPENQGGKILWQCYRDNVFLGKSDLLQYYSVTKIEFADVDSDGIDEAVISWDSDCAGSGWIHTLEVLDCDSQTGKFRSYRGITAAGPFGGFKVVSLDSAGKVQRIFAHSYVNDGMSGEECRWCPHRYRVIAYILKEDGLAVDPHWNNGKIAYTQLRFTSDEYNTLDKDYIRSSLYNTLAAEAPFVVLSPQPNQTVSLPFSLRVEIPQDMKKLGVRVLSTSSDGTEKVLLDDMIAGWAYEPGTSLKVEDSIYYAAPTSTAGMIVLYDPSHPHNKDRRARIPVAFRQMEARTVRVFFPNRKRQSDPFDEELLYPVERTIPNTGSPEKEALIQLFRGPTGVEKEQGFFTYIGPSCKAQDFYYAQHGCSNKLKDLEIKDGVAYVWTYDIDWPDPVPGMGGVHFMSVALDQIRRTLLEFPSISRVVIW